MATRNTNAARTLPGNPLGSVLRNLTRQTRSTTRRSRTIAGPQGPQGVAGEDGAAAAVALSATAGVQATTLTTSATSGQTTWQFPEPYDEAPIVTATGVGGPASVFAFVVRVDAESATIQTNTATGSLATGKSVYAIAVPQPVPDPAPEP